MKDKKIKFNNYEELLKEYPIGSIFSKRIITTRKMIFCPNDKDMTILITQYNNIERYNDLYCICTKIVEEKRVVEGYLYDGEFWYPAQNNWDGWVPYDEYDIFEEDTIVNKSDGYYCSNDNDF